LNPPKEIPAENMNFSTARFLKYETAADTGSARSNSFNRDFYTSFWKISAVGQS